MRMMNKYKYKALAKRAFSYIVRARESNYTLSKISNDLKQLLSQYEDLNVRDRAVLYNAIFDVSRKIKHRDDWEDVLVRNSTYDTVIAATRRVKKNVELRAKKKNWKQPDGTIFYLCSYHTPVAEDHKPYQGKIYVDRYWRSLISDDLYVAVLRYIKKNDIVTVQEIMGPPVYLTTRPYCRHYFIPLSDTRAVLNDADGYVEMLNKTHRNKWYDYYSVRSEVYSRLDKIHPCKQFKKKSETNR